jgi:cytochrome c peroxidase
LLDLDAAIAAGRQEDAKRAFRRARAAFKRIEMFAEYYGRFAVRELNGAPIPLAESEDPETPLPPVGLQVVEPVLFPIFDPAKRAQAHQLIIYMQRGVQALRLAGADTLPGDSYVFDAARQEIARVATLGIAGFDAAVTGAAIVESAEALAGVQDALVPYRSALSD